MKVHNNNVKFKIRDISYGLIGYENYLKSVSKLYNNLISYDSNVVHDYISESVEKQIESNYGKR